MKIQRLLLTVLIFTGCTTVAPPPAATVSGVCANAKPVPPPPGFIAPGYLHPPRHRRVLVFVHGLGGDGLTTWTASNGNYWPAMVAADPRFRDFDVYVFEYETNPLDRCLPVPDVVTTMETRLDADGVIDRHNEIYFVAHSMGGIVARQLVISSDAVAAKTKAIAYYGSPLTGSRKANRAAWISRCRQVDDLRTINVNSFLRQQAADWQRRRTGIATHCAFEPAWTGIVTYESANFQCGGVPQPLHESHGNLVKPKCERDLAHGVLQRALKGVLQPVASGDGITTTEPSRTASGLSIRRITDVGDVSAVAVAADGKTVFIHRWRRSEDMPGGIHITDVDGATPKRLFDAFWGSIVCGTSNCYMAGVIAERAGVYRFNATEPPQPLFEGSFDDIDVSPAGDRLLLRRVGPLTHNSEIVLRNIDTAAQTIERSSRESLQNASWHPDGRSILYVEGAAAGESIVQDLATGARKTLPKGNGPIVDVAWDTAGKSVLAYAQAGMTGEFWLLQPYGPPIGPLHRTNLLYADLRTTPIADTYSAIETERDDYAQLVRLDGRSVERPIGRTNVSGPISWIGSERVLYTRSDGHGSWIEEFDIHAQQDRRLSPPPGSIGTPTVTPDGTRVVFSMETDMNREYGLWTSPVDVWKPVKLAQLPFTRVAISPDSRWVAFYAFGPEPGLYVTEIDHGGEVKRLIRGYIYEMSFASPTIIIFRRESDGRRPLCKINRDGKSETCFELDGVQAFAVAPGGKTLVALTHARSESSLHFIDVPSGTVKRVVPIPRWILGGAGLQWTADGSKIVYAIQTSTSTFALESYRVADGTIEAVTNPADGLVRGIMVSPDGRYAVFERNRGSSNAVLIRVTP